MTEKPRVLVIGSSNTDMIVKSARIPRPGETILGGDFLMAQGGKGANQAVAAARLGAEVSFITCVGKDIFGNSALAGFQEEDILLDFAVIDSRASSGVALIAVDESGENAIVVAPGANSKLKPEHIERAKPWFKHTEVVLVQLEIPIETVEAVVTLAKEYGKTVILNPAPAQKLPESILSKIDYITPNQTEAGLLSGIESERPNALLEALTKQISGKVILTLGAEGVLLDGEIISAPKVRAVDTTAAGDAFNGALATALARGDELKKACQFAVTTASLSVTKIGAQPSLPYLNEVNEFCPEA